MHIVGKNPRPSSPRPTYEVKWTSSTTFKAVYNLGSFLNSVQGLFKTVRKLATFTYHEVPVSSQNGLKTNKVF